MALPTALLIKGLAGIGAIGGVVGGGFLIKKLFKPKEPNEIIKDLGITDTTCHFSETNTTATCTLDTDKLKKVKFSDKAGKEVKVTEDNKTLTLTIEKGHDTSDFTDGLRFIFKNADASNDLDIGTDNNKITLKANTSYDFKVTSDGTKLEKAWTLEALGKKVGLSCANNDATECTIKSEGINVWKEQSNYVLEATATSGSKVKVEKDQKDHKNGFKFTVSADTTINQTDNSKKVGSVDKLTQTNKSYEIGFQDIDGTKKWFLVEKDTTAAA